MTEKPKRKHSERTKLIMSERRRSRTKQPRDGSTLKADNLYKMLKKEYAKSKHKDEVFKWLEDNKHLLNESAQETREHGILTPYSDQFQGWHEIKVGSVLFGETYDYAPDNASNDPAVLIIQKEEQENETDNFD